MANANRYYKTPFAESGNKAEVPNVSTGGAVGYDTGYGPNYDLPQGNANRERIGRNEFNGFNFGVTKNLKQWQEGLYPTWIQDNGDGVAFSYPKNMIVVYAGIEYVSLQAANQEEPGTGSQWSVFVGNLRADLTAGTAVLGGVTRNFDSKTQLEGYTGSFIAGENVAISNEILQHLEVTPSSGDLTNQGGLFANEIPAQSVQNIGHKMKMKMDSNASDATMLVIGDSTGNEVTEFVYKFAARLGLEYPKYTINYHLFDIGSMSYNSAIVVSAGSGAFSLDIYNASYAGAGALSFRGAAFDPINIVDMDFILQNLGHNGGTSLSYNIIFENHFQNIMEYNGRHPSADTAIILQNFRTDFNAYSLRAVTAMRDIATIIGAQIIDIYSVFKRKEENGNISEWMSDTVHPNAIGQQRWTDIVVSQFFSSNVSTNSGGASILDIGTSLISDPYMQDLPWYSSAPVGSSVSAAIATEELTIQESGRSIKVTASASGSGFIRWAVDPQELLNVESLTFAVRMFVPSASVGANNGRVFYDTSLGTYTGSSIQRDGWIWATLKIPSSVIKNSTYFRVGMFVVDNRSVFIDRFMLIPGDAIQQPLYKTLILSEYYKPANALALNTTVINVVGNDIEVATSSVATGDFRFVINVPNALAGASYRIDFVSSVVSGGIFARDGSGGTGAILASTTHASTSLSFTAISGAFSILVTLSTGESLPRTFNDVAIVATALPVK